MCLAIPAKIVELFPDDPTLALVELLGVRRKIDTGLLDTPAQTGEWVLVHVGFAMSRISEDQAQEQLQTLAMLGEQEAALDEIRGYGVVTET